MVPTTMVAEMASEKSADHPVTRSGLSHTLPPELLPQRQQAGTTSRVAGWRTVIFFVGTA